MAYGSAGMRDSAGPGAVAETSQMSDPSNSAGVGLSASLADVLQDVQYWLVGIPVERVTS